MTEEQIRKQERDRILEIIKKEKQFGYNDTYILNSIQDTLNKFNTAV